MKTITKIFSVFAIISICLFATGQKASAQQATVSLQLFYDELSPHGRWVNYPQRGYVWMPYADAGFSPYGTRGHWVFTEYGWTWVSDYSWGWAPFHYGRWDRDDRYGWFWKPDTHWGPAWVNWRRGNGYYGWEPMEPGENAGGGYHGRNFNRNERWLFVKDRDVARPDVNNYYINRSNNVTIIKNSTVINNTQINNNTKVRYVNGPKKEDVQKSSGQPVNQVKVRAADKPGQTTNKNELQIYKPKVVDKNSDGKKPEPAKITPLKNQKPVQQNNKNANQNKPQVKQEAGKPNQQKKQVQKQNKKPPQ